MESGQGDRSPALGGASAGDASHGPLEPGLGANSAGLQSYTIVADVCEGIGDCIAVCPTECIHVADGVVNVKGCRFSFIDPSNCISCGACLSVCPLQDAILDEWKPELQMPHPRRR